MASCAYRLSRVGTAAFAAIRHKCRRHRLSSCIRRPVCCDLRRVGILAFPAVPGTQASLGSSSGFAAFAPRHIRRVRSLQHQPPPAGRDVFLARGLSSRARFARHSAGLPWAGRSAATRSCPASFPTSLERRSTGRAGTRAASSVRPILTASLWSPPTSLMAERGSPRRSSRRCCCALAHRSVGDESGCIRRRAAHLRPGPHFSVPFARGVLHATVSWTHSLEGPVGCCSVPFGSSSSWTHSLGGQRLHLGTWGHSLGP